MTRVENVLGASPVPALRDPGGGLLASVDRMHHELSHLGEEVATAVIRIDRLEATLGGVRKDLDGVQSELRHTTAVLNSVADGMRSLQAEIRSAEAKRPLPTGGKSIAVTRRGAAQLAGIATLIAALSSGVAAVIYAARGEVRAQQQTTGAPP